MNSIVALETFLIVCGILAKLCASSSEITIGLEETVRTVNEGDGAVMLCARVMSNGNSDDYAINVTIAYEDRSAVGGSDFEETPYSFIFTPNRTKHCFNVSIIDDMVYEVRQEFFVNITFGMAVGGMAVGVMASLSPSYCVIRVDDDDRVTIGWEHTSYTVGEADGQLKVCANFTGILESVLPQSSVTVGPGTAVRGTDFTFPHTTINFPKGSNSSSRMCHTVTLLKDIKYEGRKNFTLEIVRNDYERRTIDPWSTVIVITDYNVITEQQPSNICEGISNLINSSPSTADICSKANSTSSEPCDILTCSTSNWSFALSFQGCRREITLNVTDSGDNVSVSETFPSQPQLQELNHTLRNQTGRITLTSRAVSNEKQLYFLVSLDSPLLNLSFPTTAIPVECPQADISTAPTSTNATVPNAGGIKEITIIIVSATVGGVIIAMLAGVGVILAIVFCMILKNRKKKCLEINKNW